MSCESAPRPIAIVTGMLGSGKTTMIARMLRDPAMMDTLVLVNEFGEIGLDHHLLKSVSDAVVLLPNGCLCCTVKHDVLQTLRDMRRAWLSGTMPDVGRVLIETTGLAEPAPLVAAIMGDPLILDTVELAAVSTVVDAQHGPRQIEERATCRNQIRIADHLLISKSDLVDELTAAALASRLGVLNPLATIGLSADVEHDRLFIRKSDFSGRSKFTCDEPSDHIDGFSTILLRPCNELRWKLFQSWLGTLLNEFGGNIPRLKGRLTFADLSASFVIQAVHHHFYPLVQTKSDSGDDFLVLIVEKHLTAEICKNIAASSFSIF